MKIPATSLVVCALASLTLTGCLGTSPAVRYYALSSEPAPPTDKDISLGIGPFELPEYLNRPQIIVRGENERIIYHENDRWAENLEMSMSRRIVAGISKLNDGLFVYEFIRTSSFPPDYRALGQVTRFEADQNNAATLEVAWGISKIESRRTNMDNNGRRSTYQVQINSSTDIDEVTIAMGILLDMFSADIAAEISNVLANEAAVAETP